MGRRYILLPRQQHQKWMVLMLAVVFLAASKKAIRLQGLVIFEQETAADDNDRPTLSYVNTTTVQEPSEIENVQLSSLHVSPNPLPYQRYPNSTKDASTFRALSKPDELSTYFTPPEILGLQTKQCANDNSSLYIGDCCPNGHPWNVDRDYLQNLEALQQVEVTSEGEQVPPFAIRHVLKVLENQDGNDSTIRIWMHGDSTMSQLFNGFFCGLVRVGGTLQNCTVHGDRNPPHPTQCVTQQIQKGDVSFDHTGNLVSKQATFAMPEQSATIELHFFRSNPNAHCKHKNKGVLSACGAYQERLKLKHASLSPPSLVLINCGLHHHKPANLRKCLRETLTLYAPFESKLIWKETQLQHFPDVFGTGNFAPGYFPDNAIDGEQRCIDVINTTGHWRQQLAEDFLIQRYDAQKKGGDNHTIGASNNEARPSIPILRNVAAELHSSQTFGGDGKGGISDCTHRVYTPLSFDFIFWRLAKLLLAQQNR